MGEKMIEEELLNLIYSYRKAQLIYVAAKLNIPDLLEKPMTINALSKETSTNPEALHRVLKALVSIGIFKEGENGYFKNNEKSDCLKKGYPGSIRIDAIMRMEEYNWRPWGELLYSVKTGKNSFEKIFKMNLFEYLAENHEANAIFHEAMKNYTKSSANSLLKQYDFSKYKQVADIGGSSGILIKKILEKNSDLEGIIFDLPEVTDRAKSYLSDTSIKNRCKIIAGDFFEFVPEGCDLYILKKIIHDWDDERSEQILRNCFKAAPKNGKVLLIESVIMKNQLNPDILLNDVHMLVQTAGGKQRTEEEYTALLNKAGFNVTQITQQYVEATK